MSLGIPPLEITNLLESNPLNSSRFLVRELNVRGTGEPAPINLHKQFMIHNIEHFSRKSNFNLYPLTLRGIV